LVQDYEPYCQDIQYVPNFTSPELWKDIKKRPPDNQIIIGWGGSSGHVQSWMQSGIIPALSKLSATWGNLRVVVYGGGQEIPDLLKKAKIRCEFHGWVPFVEWPQHLAQFTVGLAPLAGEYDRRRSSVKVIEYGMAGVPWVVTDAEPYQDTYGGLRVKNRPDKWANAIETVMAEPQNFIEAGRRWAEAVTERCVEEYTQALGVWR